MVREIGICERHRAGVVQHVSGSEGRIFLHRSGHVDRRDHRRIVRTRNDNSYCLSSRRRIRIAAIVLHRDGVGRGHRLPCTEVLDEVVVQREVPVERMHASCKRGTWNAQRRSERREQSGTHRPAIGADSTIEGDVGRMRVRKVGIGEGHRTGIGQEISGLDANVFLHSRAGIDHRDSGLIICRADLNSHLLR